MKWLKNILKHKPKFIEQSDFPIKEVMEYKGMKYYSFDDSLNLPYERALTALTYYEEFRMRTTREYLELHCQAFDNILNSPKIKLTELTILNNQLKERLNFIIEPDLLYKLASVVIFDEKESPYVYDFKYNQAKIKLWKEDKELHSFFLQMPIINVIPFLKESELNFHLYSQVVEDLTKQHLGNILSNISENTKQNEKVNEVKLQVTT